MAADAQDDTRGGPADGTGFLVWRVANLWQKQQRRALDAAGLTPVQYLLLAGLTDLTERAAGPITQAALAQHCRTDPMMTSQVLRALADGGLIRRRAHRGDGRAMALVPTASGRAKARSARDAVRAADADFFARLGEEETLFADVLRLLAGERPRRRVKAGRRS
ncbi:MAG: MarR family winged helix-turn-helix transcriptional regulator [Alphaproteobacteria bacterium]